MKTIKIKNRETAQGILSLCKGKVIDSEGILIQVPDCWIDIIRQELGVVFVQDLKDQRIIEEI